MKAVVIRQGGKVVGVVKTRGDWRIGDLISKATKLLGLKECDDCKKRRASLNRFRVRL